MAFISATFASAMTNYVVVTCPSGMKPIITGAFVALDGGVSVNVAANISFGAFGSNPLKVATGHPGIIPGSGFVEDRRLEGQERQNIVFSCGVPTGGTVQLNLSYELYPLPGAS